MYKVLKGYQFSTLLILQFIMNSKRTSYVYCNWHWYEFLQVFRIIKESNWNVKLTVCIIYQLHRDRFQQVNTAFKNIPAGNYIFKVYNRSTRTRFEFCSTLTIKTPFTWTYFTPCSNISIVNFEQVNVGWDFASISFSDFTRHFRKTSSKRKDFFGKVSLTLSGILYCASRFHFCSEHVRDEWDELLLGLVLLSKQRQT